MLAKYLDILENLPVRKVEIESQGRDLLAVVTLAFNG